MFFKPRFTKKEIADLHLSYQNAVYEVFYGGQTIQLFIDRHNPKLDLILEKYDATTWALITAFNPYSQCLSAAENERRHQSLIKLLQLSNLSFFDAVGKDKNGVWTPEESLFIIGIEPVKAIAIGNKFQQNAIVLGTSAKRSRLLWL